MQGLYMMFTIFENMQNSRSPIYFHFLKRKISLRDRSHLKEYIISLLRKHGRRVEVINYVFCSDEYLFEINQKYLRHNTYTDIITFELSGKDDKIVSDIYISIDRVRENAGLLKISLNKELHRVIFHGTLHLCGYKDKSTRDKKIMRLKEDFYLTEYFVSRGNQKLKS